MGELTAGLQFLLNWSSAFWMTLRETGPFLVFGLVLAGVLHVLVPSRIILWALGQGGWRGALRGALIGTPLPLCSCGVIPTALTLRRQGASLSATTAFTISTPETSIDALAITAALLPSVFLGVRPFAAILLAFIVGYLVETFSRTTGDDLRMNVMNFSRCNDGCESATSGAAAGGQTKKLSESEVCRVCGLMAADDEHRHGVFAKTRAIFGYAFGTFFRDIATWLIVGLALAAFLQIIVPSNAFNEGWLARHAAFQVLAAILIGIPLYSCATATTPMVAVLMAKGLNPGAALALLLAGPATNIGNVFALKREFGVRVTFIYYAALFLLCFGFGIIFSMSWPLVERVPSLTQVASFGSADFLVHGMPGWLEVCSAWLLVVLSLKSWVSSLLFHPHHHEGHSH